jgi:hypothetical protein
MSDLVLKTTRNPGVCGLTQAVNREVCREHIY